MSRWDKSQKLYTRDCPSCPYNLGECFWGVAVKLLMKTDRPRQCQYRTQAPPKDSMWRLIQWERERQTATIQPPGLGTESEGDN